MYKNNDKVSTSQMTSILILTLVGTGILTLPASLADVAGTDGWLVIVVGALAAFLMVRIHSYIIKAFPGKGLMEILIATVTKPVAYAIVAIYSIYFIILVGFLMRIFGEVIKMFLLFRTPIEVIMFSMLITSIYLIRRGIEPLGRLAELLLPLIFIFSLFIFLLTIQGSDFTNLLPVFQTSPLEIIKAVPIVFFSFIGFEIILVFGMFLNVPQKVNKSTSLTILIVGIMYLFLNFMVLGRFGTKQTMHLIWPTLTLFKTIEFPGLFIENVEAVVMVLWVFNTFMSLTPVFLAGTMTVANVFNARDHSLFALPLVPFIYFAALLPDSVAESYFYLDLFANYVATSTVIVIPILIAGVILIRRGLKKEGKNA